MSGAGRPSAFNQGLRAPGVPFAPTRKPCCPPTSDSEARGQRLVYNNGFDGDGDQCLVDRTGLLTGAKHSHSIRTHLSRQGAENSW